MSSDAHLEDEVRRGEQAHALITHPLLAEAFDTINTELMQAWQSSPARDVEGRETLWLSVKLLGQVKQHLQSCIETGQLANLDLSRRGLSAPR
jgi:hypothetical protein